MLPPESQTEQRRVRESAWAKTRTWGVGSHLFVTKMESYNVSDGHNITSH